MPPKAKKNTTVTTQTLTPEQEDDNFFLLNHEEDQKEDDKEDSLVIEQNDNEEEKQKKEIKKEAGHAGGFDDVPPIIIEKKEDADISRFDDIEPEKNKEKDQEKENSYWDKYYDQEMKNARTDEEVMFWAAMKDFELNTPMPEDEEEEQKEENKEVQKEDVNEDDSFVIAMDEDDDKKENKKENIEDDSFVIAMDDDEPEPVNKKEAQMKALAAAKINKNLMDAFQKILDNKKDGKANSDLYNNIINEYVESMNAQTPSEFVMHMRHLSDACVKYTDNRHPISQAGKDRKKIVEQLHQVVEEEIMPEINKKLDTFEVVDKDKVNGEMLKESADKPLVEKTSFKNILDEEGINTARKTKVTLSNKDKSNSNTLKK